MNIQKNIALSQHTTFKTGGMADFFCEIKTKDDLLEVFRWIRKDGLKYFALGNGSNLLVNDAGFRGVAVKPANDSIVWKSSQSVTGAGVLLPALIMEAKKYQLGGMEWAFGIPATLGGAVRNNAGAFGSDMSKIVEAVEIFDSSSMKFKVIKNKECSFSYHRSVFQDQPTWLIWEVTLEWEKKNQDLIDQAMQKFLNQRKNRQPLERPSAGSYFRNPSLAHLEKNKKEEMINTFVEVELAKCAPDQDKFIAEKETRTRVEQADTLPAAYLIEATGLKGRTIGGAQVSEKHANFIINTGGAKTEDVVILASMVKQKVRNKFGVQLHEEVEYVGF
jgi:UDP-N-acetylmuramate dehydrogenase